MRWRYEGVLVVNGHPWVSRHPSEASPQPFVVARHWRVVHQDSLRRSGVVPRDGVTLLREFALLHAVDGRLPLDLVAHPSTSIAIACLNLDYGMSLVEDFWRLRGFDKVTDVRALEGLAALIVDEAQRRRFL